MTAGTLTLPTIARFGFDDGWLILGPHFLKFGLPGLLIDYRLADEVCEGLETFGARHPENPWTPAAVDIRCTNGYVGIWTKHPTALVASRWLGKDLDRLKGYDRLLVMVGDTHAVQLSWSALWTCRIGVCKLTASVSQRAENGLDAE